MSDLQTFFRDTEPWIAAAAVSKYGDPEGEETLLKAISPLRAAANIDVPMLIVHGELDSNVPRSEAVQIVGALRRLGQPVEYLQLEGEGHEYRRADSRKILIRRMLHFLSDALDGIAAATTTVTRAPWLSWSVLTPLIALLVLALTWGRKPGTFVVVVVALILGAAVLSAVNHAEIVAHRVGEPFGSLVLAVAVTIIEVALIVTLMVSGGPETSSLARDTVFAAVMITATASSVSRY